MEKTKLAKHPPVENYQKENPKEDEPAAIKPPTPDYKMINSGYCQVLENLLN